MKQNGKNSVNHKNFYEKPESRVVPIIGKFGYSDSVADVLGEDSHHIHIENSDKVDENDDKIYKIAPVLLGGYEVSSDKLSEIEFTQELELEVSSGEKLSIDGNELKIGDKVITSWNNEDPSWKISVNYRSILQLPGNFSEYFINLKDKKDMFRLYHDGILKITITDEKGEEHTCKIKIKCNKNN